MSDAIKLPSNFTLYTDNRLSAVTFSQDDVGKIIQNLKPKKSHGHDNISIRMLKICGSSIYGPLELLFQRSFRYWLVSIKLEKREHCSYP